MKEYYHFIGIGGIGMSGVAHLLLKAGFSVSGSDLKENRVTEELKRLGAKIFIGHRLENICGQSAVVYSSAIKEDNPEIRQAKKSGIKLLKRAEALALLMHHKTAITIAGSHGKTTTTSLISYMLLEAGLCPTVAIGGILKNIDTNACLGSGELFVAEADESDGSFLYYQPKYSIITNIDREHLDYYRSFENELNAFKDFLNRTQDGGCVFACADDLNLKKLISDYKRRSVSFGLNEPADISAKNIELNGLSSDFDCYFKDKFISRFHLALGGRHNISNSLAVIGLGLELGIDLSFIRRTLEGYKGAGRRLEIKFKSDKYLVLDDYAHHPSEIKATLAAVANLGVRRKIVVFQPHRYSRTQLLLNEFADSFELADHLVISDIYAASEQPIEGVDALGLLRKIKEGHPHKQAVYLAKEKITEYLLDFLRPGDILITLGAGDIVKVADDLAEKLK
ncbi:MAG: UDP-N-acetylmuramate--L-alanine ligase [Candidatus Omnitrophota bacterium]|jgi:UDP-N-acetylmuramate--alanine ligase|nr:UDP-N-acetylmuramate--L-alanine ligase [Candidatus Omnitrophota bacterium]